MSTNHQPTRCVCFAALMATLTACGGGGSGAIAPNGSPATSSPSATYTVSGTVTGLSGPSLVLEMSDSFGNPYDLTVKSSGSFTFDAKLGSGVGYGVGVKTQPLTPPQYCQVGEPSGSGTIGAADVTNVLVTCAAGYTAGGTVSGLVGSGLVLQLTEPDPYDGPSYATGQGPSSIAVNSLGSLLYVANNGGSNDISAFMIDAATGELTPMAGSPFAAGASPLSLAFGASGKFLYSANPGGTNPSITGFTVDSSGALIPLSGSPFPAAVNRSIAVRGGAYLYATTAAGVLGYYIDATTGLLTLIPGFPVIFGTNSYSATVDPTSQFLYVANNGSANVSGFRFDDSGGLTPVSGSPFAAGNSPDSLTTP